MFLIYFFSHCYWCFVTVTPLTSVVKEVVVANWQQEVVENVKKEEKEETVEHVIQIMPVFHTKKLSYFLNP